MIFIVSQSLILEVILVDVKTVTLEMVIFANQKTTVREILAGTESVEVWFSLVFKSFYEK